jgi:FdhD protein
MMMKDAAVRTWPATKVRALAFTPQMETLAVEEPLEIELIYSTSGGRLQKTIAVTMRTPGEDAALAIGFLFSEGIIAQYQQIASVQNSKTDNNKVVVTLVENEKPVLDMVHRNFISNASCGLCGKSTLNELWQNRMPPSSNQQLTIDAGVLYELPKHLSEVQQIFASTGGLHAAALVNATGELIVFCEDIGRHNAVDKIVGMALQQGLHLQNLILLLSGRAGYELVQKAAVAGIPIIAAIGAPSSLAVELADECGLTLVGFLKLDRFNIYCGASRIKPSPWQQLQT